MIIMFIIGVLIGVGICVMYISKQYAPRKARMEKIIKSVNNGYLTKRESVETMADMILLKK
jgi:hypothetical protein